MNKRNYIEEIQSIKDRSKFPGRFELIGRIYAIDSILYPLEKENSFRKGEILKYIPIATVACFESFFRSIVSELIDLGEPYNQNVLKFNQSNNIKFDFKIVNAIQKKKISVGDFVSHILSCNNLKDFNSNLSILIETDFLEALKKFEPKENLKISLDISKKFKKKHSQIIQSIDSIFNLRHIFCHEFATKVELDYLTTKENYENCKLFLFQVNDYIMHLLYPDFPTTQFEINKQASEGFEKAEAELNNVINKIKNLDLSEENIHLDNTDIDLIIEKWKEYRKVKAEAFAKHSKDGTIYPTLKLNSLKATTEKMITELIEEYGLKMETASS